MRVSYAGLSWWTECRMKSCVSHPQNRSPCPRASAYSVLTGRRHPVATSCDPPAFGRHAPRRRGYFARRAASEPIFIFHQVDGKLFSPNAEETEQGRRGDGEGGRDRIYRIDKIKGDRFPYSISRHPVNPVKTTCPSYRSLCPLYSLWRSKGKVRLW